MGRRGGGEQGGQWGTERAGGGGPRRGLPERFRLEFWENKNLVPQNTCMCQREAAVICWLINKLPLTKDGRRSSYEQYLHGRCTILSPHRPTLAFLCKPCGLAAGTGEEALQVGGSELSSPDKREREKYHCLPCPSLQAHVELTEICIQLRSTRQLWLHACTNTGFGDLPCPLSPLQL